MTTWFLSDLHLRDTFERNGNTLLRFLFELNQNPSQHRLMLLGDIFDVWVSSGKVFAKKFELIVGEIAKLKRGGGEVYYFEGNHDVHIGRFWTDKYNIPVFQKEHYFDIDGLRIRVEHGDYINPADTAYFKWLDAMRSPALTFLAHNVPGHFWNWLAVTYTNRVSSRKTYRYTPEHAERIRNMIRVYAESVYSQEKFDLIVTGHMHVFDNYEFQKDGRAARSINLGTWLERPRVLKIENKSIEVLNL